MTVSSSYTPVTGTGNGTTTTFAVPWPFTTPSDLAVSLLDTSTGNQVAGVTLGGAGTYGYTVTGTPNADSGEWPSGSVVFNTAPGANHNYTIGRAVPTTQPVSLTNNAPFPAKVVEGALDRLTMLAQQVGYQVSLLTSDVDPYLAFPTGDTATITTLPSVAARAGNVLGFDAQGNPTAVPLVINVVSTSVTISPAVQPTLNSATLPLFLSAIGAAPNSGTKTIAGDTTFTNNVTVSGNETVTGTLGVAGAATFASTVGMSAADNWAQGTAIASAATINLDSLAGNSGHITGATTITGVTLSAGRVRVMTFDGILTLTNGASLVLPGGANITTAAGDMAIFIGDAGGVVRVMYLPVSGKAVVAAAAPGIYSASVDSQLFTASGTWNKPGSGTYTIVIGIGGGGGGARQNVGANWAMGGNAGDAVVGVFLTSALTATVAVTIGAKGSGMTGSNGAGGAGGQTSFGSYLQAAGGAGGAAAIDTQVRDSWHGGGGTSLVSDPSFTLAAGTPFRLVPAIVTPLMPYGGYFGGYGGDKTNGSPTPGGNGVNLYSTGGTGSANNVGSGTAGTGFGAGGGGGYTAGGDGTAGALIAITV